MHLAMQVYVYVAEVVTWFLLVKNRGKIATHTGWYGNDGFYS